MASGSSNNSTDHVPQLAILKRGKRQVATQIKSDINSGRTAGQRQLEEILTFLLEPEKPVDSDTADWLKYLISGGGSFEEYSENVRQYDVTKVCGLVWTAHFIAYRCRTCGISPCMSLCPDCFYGADHTGHDFNMFRSHAGGACDCGDVNVMKPEGFCTKHGKLDTATKAVPPEVTNTAKMVIDRLITKFVYYLRSKHQEWVTVGGERFVLDDGEHLLALLHDLSGLGVVIRTIISEALIDSNSYAKEFELMPDDLDSTTLNPHRRQCHDQYRKAKAGLPAPQPKFYRVKVCGRDASSTTRTHWRCSYECMQSVVNDISICDDLNHKTALEEIMFWTIRYEFPELITTWLLALLPVDAFKEEFTKTFVDHYTRISTSVMQCKGNDQRQRVSNKVVHVSVQLFSNEVYAVRMVSERQLLTRMVISMYNMLNNNLIQSTMTGVSMNTHQVLDCSNDVIKDHCFWPLISDLVNIMSHKPVALIFMEDPVLLDVWFEMMGFLQGMNLNERELMQHVEYESETYYASFSAEFEVSCSPLWRLLLHCTDSATNNHLALVLKKAMEALNIWFDSVCLTRGDPSAPKVNEYQISFHLPLHRYFAAFLCSAVLNKALVLQDELSEEFLKLVMIHPLQIQAAFYEIFAQMWVRNGLQIRGQAMTYTQCHFCNSLIDLDIYLLQVCASQLDADYFVHSVIKAFHVEHWSLPVDAMSARDNIEPGQDESMLEGLLTLLAMLLCIRTYSGESTEAILHAEIVTLLCINDRTYSQLCDSIPEKSGSTNPPADLKNYLQKVAEYKAPGFNVNGKLQQGTYSATPDVWVNEFSPLHVMLRTVHRREFQQSMDRYTEFVHNSKLFPHGQTPWPPLRTPVQPLPAYAGLYNMLHSRTMMILCFNLLHKKLTSKVHTVTEAVLYLTIFLVQMMVDSTSDDTKMVGPSRKNNWFPHSLVLDNILHVVGAITIQASHKKSKDADNADSMMDVEETTVEDSIQTMFSSQTSMFPLSEPVVRPLQLVRDRGSAPGALPTPAPVVPVSSSSSTSFSKEVDVNVNESFVSLLIKLHNKLCEKEGSYLPISHRSEEVDNSKLVGNGPFFVGRVLDTLSSKSSKCAQAIEKVYYDLKPREDNDSASKSAKQKMKAKDRQKKLLAKMNKMQSKFMDKIEKTMSKEEFEKLTEAEMPEDNYVVIEHYECSICSSTTPSTMERPMGMVALLQSTSVLNFARSDPAPEKLSLSKNKVKSGEIFSDYYSRASDRLNHLFADKLRGMAAIGVDRGSDVFVQSCGHYLHLDCFKAYNESFTAQSRQRQTLAGDDYHCPLCRQLANVLVPVLPTGSEAPLVAIAAEDPLMCTKELAAMLEQKPSIWPSESFYRELSSLTLRLSLNSSGNSKFMMSEGPEEMAHFFYSVARCNLDFTALYETNDIVVPSRKSPIAHLLRALTQSVMKLEGQGPQCVDLLAQLTGIGFEPVGKALVPHQGVVPLILRDPITVLLQLYVKLPPHLAIGYFERLVSAVYNLAYVQALFHVSCKFNEDERQSWMNRRDRVLRQSHSEVKGRRVSTDVASGKRLSVGTDPGSRRNSDSYALNRRLTSPMVKRDSEVKDIRINEQLLYTIIKQLTTIRFYPTDDTTMSFLECSVWSPQSVECFIQNRCLPLLQFAATLKKHVYDSPLPDLPATCTNSDLSCSQDCQQRFSLLCKHLGLIKLEETTDSPSTQALQWAGQDPQSLVKGWLNFVMTSKDRPTIRSYIMDSQRWYMPKLLELPDQYDSIFQFYRNRKCPQCERTPTAPSICLICGAFVCFKEVCCISQSGVTHAKVCGSGTSVILDINASIVAIIRGKRATLWGSVYLDEHGEEDRDLKRGRPLYLCKERYKMLEQQWLSHNFDYVCKRWIFHSDQL